MGVLIYKFKIMRLFIARHGETSANVSKTCQGHFNSQLTDQGVLQAEQLAKRLREECFDAVFSSDLDRARKTSEAIMAFHSSATIEFTPVLREQAKGVFEGKSYEERDKVLMEGNIPYYDWNPEGGESLIDVWEKVVDFLEEIIARYVDKTVLIVSHGGPISCILTHLHGKRIEDYDLYMPKGNTALSIVNINAEGLGVEVLNSVEHLKGK